MSALLVPVVETFISAPLLLLACPPFPPLSVDAVAMIPAAANALDLRVYGLAILTSRVISHLLACDSLRKCLAWKVDGHNDDAVVPTFLLYYSSSIFFFFFFSLRSSPFPFLLHSFILLFYYYYYYLYFYYLCIFFLFVAFVVVSD